MDRGHLGPLGQPAALNVSKIEGEHVQTLLLESQMEDIVLEIKVDVEDLTVTEIMAIFTVSQGGRFASEMLGFPGLSGIGPVEIDLLIKFGNYGENFGIQGPAK